MCLNKYPLGEQVNLRDQEWLIYDGYMRSWMMMIWLNQPTDLQKHNIASSRNIRSSHKQLRIKVGSWWKRILFCDGNIDKYKATQERIKMITSRVTQRKSIQGA